MRCAKSWQTPRRVSRTSVDGRADGGLAGRVGDLGVQLGAERLRAGEDRPAGGKTITRILGESSASGARAAIRGGSARRRADRATATRPDTRTSRAPSPRHRWFPRSPRAAGALRSASSRSRSSSRCGWASSMRSTGLPKASSSSTRRCGGGSMLISCSRHCWYARGPRHQVQQVMRMHHVRGVAVTRFVADVVFPVIVPVMWRARARRIR